MKTSHCHHRFLTTAFLLCLGLAAVASPAARACDKYTHCKPCDCPCKCGCSGLAGSAGGVSQPGSETSVAPVRYINGDARIMADDFDSGAAAAPLWGHTRYYSNAFPNDNSFGNGNRWFVGQWPLLVQEGASIMVLFEPLRAYWFDPAQGGGYTPRYGAKQTLVHDTVNLVYRMTDPDGTAWEFNEFSSGNTPTTLPDGLFKRRVTPGGQVVNVSVFNATQILQVQFSLSASGTVYEQYDYSYGSSGAAANQLTSVTLSRCAAAGSTLTPAREVTYTYYGSNDSCGLPGDLQTATCYYAFDASKNPTGSGDTYYYRYYTDNSNNGFPHGLKYVFRPQAYNNLAAFLGHAPTSNDNDPTVQSYACYYFQYDSDHRVTYEEVFGQSQKYQFGYTAGGGNDPNTWQTKTVENELNTSGGTLYSNTVYSNPIGQVLATVLTDTSGNAWRTYRQYNADYNLVLEAEPSAVANLQEASGGNLTVTPSSTGLVREMTYYADNDQSATETAAGGAPGYVAYELVRQAGASLAPQFSGDTGPGLTVSGGAAAVLGYRQYFAHGGTSSVTGGTATLYQTATETVFTDPSGSAATAITTSYSYSWCLSNGTGAATLQVQQAIAHLPAVPAAQNNLTGTSGGTAGATRCQYFNSLGQLTWEQDERGRLTCHEYDPTTGLLTETIADVVNSGNDSSGNPLVSPWGSAPSDGLNVWTDYSYDLLGRVAQTLGPAFNNDQGNSVRTAAWIVHDDPDHIVYSAPGCLVTSDSTATLFNPVSIEKYDSDGRILQSIQAASGTAISASGSLLALSNSALSNLATSQSGYCRWTVNRYSKTRPISTAIYFAVPSTTSTDSNGFVGTMGTPGVSGVSTGNYDMTQFGYESLSGAAGALMGRQNKTVGPGGTITRTVFDVQGNTTATWVGTNDDCATDSDPSGGGAPGNNMVQVSGSMWNVDGTLAQSSLLVSTTGTQITTFGYDWRDRQTSVTINDGLNNSGNSYITQNILDNLGRAIETDGYVNSTSASNLVTKSTAAYDPLGRVYQRQTFAVHVGSGAVGNALTASTWYDAAGNVLLSKVAGSGTNTFTKAVYDGLNRPTATYAGYCPSGGTLAQVPTLSGTADLVFEQNETTYDAAGNVVLLAARSRLPTAATAAGALGGVGSPARSLYAQAWFDGMGRRTVSANYGTSGGTQLGGIAPAVSTATCLVNSTAYNWRGEAFQTTDPMGRIDQQTFDDAGRTIQTIQNVVTGGTTSDQNITLLAAFTPDGQIATLTAINSATGNQVLQYAYGTSLSMSDSVARTDLLKAVIYPSSTDSFTMSAGTPAFNAVDNLILYTYNRLGERISMTDENGTTHAYAIDALGRLTTDTVHVASGVDGTVQQIARTYEVRGMVQDVKSYATSGAVVNDVLMLYNDFGQLTAEYQAHGGDAVGGGPNASPAVQYSYASGTANTIRPLTMTYPNGRVINYGYKNGDDDNLSRLSFICDSGGTLSQVNYLGLSRIVTETYPQPGVTLDYTGGTAADYSGLDNFDRIAQQSWTVTSGTLDQFNYTSDFAGNRLYRQNVAASGKNLDELYQYDNVYRLQQSRRGTLNLSGASASISGTPVFEENWGLDATGNWGSYSQSLSGSLTLSQTRSHNMANELQNIMVGGGTTSLAYDQAGNMTAMPLMPSGGRLALMGSCTYDAWNRLVQASSSTAALASFSYDGLGRRIQKSSSSATDYYLADQQVVETDISPPPAGNGQGEMSGSTSLQYQYVWSPRYIDAPILRDDFTTSAAYPRAYYLDDASFNVTSLVSLSDASWQPVERYVYDAYGSPTFQDNAWNLLTSSTANNGVLYTGQELDPETGLYYYRARYYDAQVGRFTGRDPIASDVNDYRYCGDAPTILIDPSGLARIDAMVTRGKGVEACEGCCGPDVSAWFFKDLHDHAIRLGNQKGKLSGLAFSLEFKETAAHYLAYKWMPFSVAGATCATGACHDTVWLGTLSGGACVRKNVLGNIAFGYLVDQFKPDYPTFTDLNGQRVLGVPGLSAIQHAYDLGATLGSDNPSQSIYGNRFLGAQRADNLVAFAAGVAISEANASTYQQFLVAIDDGVGPKAGKGTLNTYKKMYENASGTDLGDYPFTPDTLTFVPAGGAGFNTRSCKPCLVTNSKPPSMVTFTTAATNSGNPSSMDSFLGLKKKHGGRRQNGLGRPRPPLDAWLLQTYGNY